MEQRPSALGLVLLTALLPGCASTGPLSGPASPPGSANAATGTVPNVTTRKPLTPDEQRYLDRAMAQPRSATPWFELGNYYAANQRLAAAEFAYREALKRDPAPETWHNLGLVQIRLGLDALLQARQELPPNDQATAETRALLQALLEEYP